MVAVIHHTGCATGFLAHAGFRSGFAARTGLDEAELAVKPVIDPEATVRADVQRLLASPQVQPQISVSGHVSDLDTGLVTTIVGPAQPQPAQRPPADERLKADFEPWPPATRAGPELSARRPTRVA